MTRKNRNKSTKLPCPSRYPLGRWHCQRCAFPRGSPQHWGDHPAGKHLCWNTLLLPDSLSASDPRSSWCPERQSQTCSACSHSFHRQHWSLTVEPLQKDTQNNTLKYRIRFVLHVLFHFPDPVSSSLTVEPLPYDTQTDILKDRPRIPFLFIDQQRIRNLFSMTPNLML